jgi:ribosome-associated protein
MSKTDGQHSHASSLADVPAEIRTVIDAALSKKAAHVVVLDLRKSHAFADFFVICSGQNPRQVGAIADAVETSLRGADLRPAHIEGEKQAEWVLMDYFDFIVHVFTPSTREFYGLERLWGSAVRIEVDERGAEARG